MGGPRGLHIALVLRHRRRDTGKARSLEGSSPRPGADDPGAGDRRRGPAICTEMVPGNTADVTVLVPVVDRLRERFGIARACVVADRGMISAETIAALERLGMEYILDARERSSSVVRDIVLEDEAAMVPLVLERQKGETQLWVKEVRVGTGKSAQRYIVSVNEAEAEKDKADRQAIIAGLEAQLKKGDKALVGNSAYRRYLRKTAKDKAFEIDAGKLAEEARFDGVTVLRTNAKVTQHRPDRRHVEARARLAAQIAGGRGACCAACRLLRCLHVDPTCSASPTSRPSTASCREALEWLMCRVRRWRPCAPARRAAAARRGRTRPPHSSPRSRDSGCPSPA
ncbi:transposase [Aquamicrobium sp.]|uniref:IS1634 family transposase n=1 Tax=Aquamicrobium sp. TaxID=1872579 RepID=UPI00349EF590